MKKLKFIFMSLLVIVFCVSVISGATYALFTSNETVNIAVTSGTVKITATPTITHLYSITPDENGEIVVGDAHYSHQEQPLANGEFKTHGTAAIDSNGNVVLTNMVPGDKAVIKIAVANDSNVSIRYRLKIAAVDDQAVLLDALTTTIESSNITKVSYEKLVSYNSDGYLVASTVEDIDNIFVTIEIPAQIGNDYQTLAASFVLTVEAVQGNAIFADASHTTH